MQSVGLYAHNAISSVAVVKITEIVANIARKYVFATGAFIFAGYKILCNGCFCAVCTVKIENRQHKAYVISARKLYINAAA